MHSRTVGAEQPPSHDKGELRRKLAKDRVTLAAGGGGVGGRETAGTRRPTTESAAQQQQRRVRGVGWVKRFPPSRTATSTDENIIQHREDRQQQRPILSRMVAMVNGMSKATSRAGSTAPGAPGADSPGQTTTDTVAAPCPRRSYLEWSSKRNGLTDDDQSASGKPDTRRRKNEAVLAMGMGSRAAPVDSSGDSGSAPSGEKGKEGEEGSLEAAKTSRGGGGAGAVSLTFKEAMFAGAISRSIAQVREREHGRVINAPPMVEKVIEFW